MPKTKDCVLAKSVKHQLDQFNCFISQRERMKTLRSFSNNKEVEKEMFYNFTKYVICNKYYMELFLEYLQNNNESLKIEIQNNYISELTKNGHQLIDSYENSDMESRYLKMCNYVKDCIDNAKIIVRYLK